MPASSSYPEREDPVDNLLEIAGKELSPIQREMLDAFYKDSETEEGVAKRFGVSVMTVSRVLNSPAGERYALQAVGKTRNRINLMTARLLEALMSSGAVIPAETLIKLYQASLPRETPTSAYDAVLQHANMLAAKHNLSPEQRDRLVRVALGQEQA